MNGYNAPRPPVVGITAEGMDKVGNIILPRVYADCVRRAGGQPVILLPWQSGAEVLENVDALILAGGGDINPELYVGPEHPAIYEVDPVRDEGEIALLRAALAKSKPILAICRGMQLANVALGGSLHAHLPDVFGHQVVHRAEPYGGVVHEVQIVAGSRLARLLGSDTTTSISWHHQAIKRVAEPLVAAAHSADGLIEALEYPDAIWFFAVQWHPEISAAQDRVQQRLFDGLVNAAHSHQLSESKAGAAGKAEWR